MLRGAQPLTWTPHGCTDAVDASQSFPGCMTQLANLIPDPSTSDLWMCRPAITRLTNFPTFITPGFISCSRVVGNFIYGLMRTGRTLGFEEPFVWDLANNIMVTITGVTGANVPAQVASSGAWVPPIMDVIGSKVVVCHPGFAATGFKFGWFDISNPAAITWNAGNTTGGIVLATIPTFVAQFNGRAYYIVNTVSQPAVVFSDPLAPTVVTNASQVLTFGDAVALTAIGQLRLYNQLGGIIQALMVFKGAQNTYQITGDSALGTLAVNSLSVATGTLSPLGIAPSPKGLAFISPDGLRIIDFQGNISEPIGQDGKGITVPMTFSNVPSRMVLACNGSLVRVSTQNANALGTPFQEWWFDLGRGSWSGPHTCAFNTLQGYNLTFVGQPQANPVGLWQSDVVQGQGSTFTETLDPNIRVLMHLDGTNASTVANDDAPNPHLFTVTGTAQLDTVTKKFGSASGKFDGGGSWSTPSAADLYPGSSNFTLEGWFSCTMPLGFFPAVCGRSLDGSPANDMFKIIRDNNGHVTFAVSDGVNFFNPAVSAAVYSDVANLGFHHFAGVRSGNTLYFFIDGILLGTTAFTGAVNNVARPFFVGSSGQPGTEWKGWADEIELTIGTAKYTANFAPPTAPFTPLTSTLIPWTYQTALFPDPQQMGNVSLSQTLLNCALATTTSYSVSISDGNGTVLNSVQVALGGSVAVWGAFNWGAALWGSGGGALSPRIVPWTKQNVFATGRITVQGNANSTVRLGQLWMKYKILKYLTNLGAVG